ncbi:flavin reductase family protein [Vibrio makurazakiensis]|uniref:flavin reductase family protein n=1 Tax=Vibrio makurazakiensis TaxID=2910250 RepID=UPI003D126526
MNLKFDTLAPTQIYHLMTQTVVPRPVAWTLTESSENNFNLAPFSYFTPVSSNPPLLMISVGKKPNGDIKDTTRNVLETGKLVIHIAGTDSAKAMTESAATLEHGESEIVANDIELTDFEGFDLPRLAECDIAFGCTLFEVKEIGETPQSLIFAQVEQVYISQSVIDGTSERLKIDTDALDPISRLGGGEYAKLGDVFAVARPK